MAISVILAPIYTRWFSVAEYGIIENLNIFGVLLTCLFGLALSEAIFRFYGTADREEERRRLLSTAIVATAASGALVIVTVQACVSWLGQSLLHEGSLRSQQLFLILTLSVTTNLLLTLMESALRARFRRRQYLMMAIGCLLVSTMVTLVSLFLLDLEIYAVFIGPIVGGAVFVLYGWRSLYTELRVGAFSLDVLSQMARYSVPFVPAGLALFAIRSSDRYFITFLLNDPLTQVGLYGAAEKIMGPLALVGAAFATAWTPFAMAASRQPHARELYVAAFKHYVALSSIGAVALPAVSPLLLAVLTTPPYYPSAIYTPPLALYLALNALYYIGSIGLMLSNNTRLLIPMLGGAAAMNGVLNLVLIPHYGVLGAAWSTVASFAAFNIMVYMSAERKHWIGYPLGRAAIVYCLSGLNGHISLYSLSWAAAALLFQVFAVAAVRLVSLRELWFGLRALVVEVQSAKPAGAP